MTARAGLLLLSFVVVLGLILVSFPSPTESSKPKRDRGHHVRVSGTKIVGGSKVPQGTYRFATYLVVSGNGGFSCSGSLVAQSFVVTAAHCVEDDNGAIVSPSRFTLTIGRANVRNPPSANTFRVSRVFQHPQWDSFSLTNDIAVLQLSSAVPSSVAQPIAMVASNDTRYDRPGQGTVTAGWGLTSGNGNSSPDLLKAGMTVISDAACAKYYSDGVDGASVLCTQMQSRSTCNGDSGGPLFVTPANTTAKRQSKGAKQKHEIKAERKHRKKKKRHKPDPPAPAPTVETLIGVTSFGAIGCPPGSPAGFTQLSAPGIRDFVSDALDEPTNPSRATVSVDARVGSWQSVPGFTLSNGDVFSATVTSGQWTHWQGGRPYNGGGGESVACGTGCPLPDYNLGGLVLRAQGADGGEDIVGNGPSAEWEVSNFAEPITVAFRINEGYVSDNDGVLTVEVVKDSGASRNRRDVNRLLPSQDGSLENNPPDGERRAEPTPTVVPGGP